MTDLHAHADQPLRHKIVVNGLGLIAWEWPGEGDPVLLVHATGFHGRCWQQVVRFLPGRRIIAVDLPSHGESGRKTAPYNWTGLGDDLIAVIDALGLQSILGVGHSIGGHLVTLAAAGLGERFRGLFLIDPVIMQTELPRIVLRGMTAKDHPVARRRDRWESPQQMFATFRERDPYWHWDEAVLRDYCEGGLLWSADRSVYELACPPLLEAEVYVGMHMEDIFAAIARVVVPVEIVRARSRRPDEALLDYSPSPTWERLAEFFSDATDEQLADRSHFIPMELPQWTAEKIAGFDCRHARLGRECATLD